MNSLSILGSSLVANNMHVRSNMLITRSTFDPICSVSAWMAPGHAFVDFNCGDKKKTIGFNPDPKDELKMFFEIPAKQPILVSNMMTLGEQFSSSSQSGSGGSAYSSPVSYAKTSGTSSASMTIPVSSSIPGSGNLFLGASSTQGIGTSLLFHDLKGHYVRAVLRNDRYLLNGCLDRRIPCMVKHLNVTSEVFEKAWKKMLTIEKEIILNAGDQCPLTSSDRYKYSLLSNNCVDFMRRIMASTGVLNWKQGFQFSSPPTSLDKLSAIAWHYFNWT